MVGPSNWLGWGQLQRHQALGYLRLLSRALPEGLSHSQAVQNAVRLRSVSSCGARAIAARLSFLEPRKPQVYAAADFCQVILLDLTPCGCGRLEARLHILWLGHEASRRVRFTPASASLELPKHRGCYLVPHTSMASERARQIDEEPEADKILLPLQISAQATAYTSATIKSCP